MQHILYTIWQIKIQFIRNLIVLLNENAVIYIGDVAFETRKDFEKCKKQCGEHWDNEEIYFVYDEIKKEFTNSEYVMTVWNGENLIGLISAITDGYINVFITYLLVKPEYQKMGLGKIMMNDFMKKFEGFGRWILTTELDKEEYYKKFGFNIDGIAMFNNDWKEDIEG